MQEIINRDGQLYYIQDYLGPNLASKIFNELRDELEWRQDEITLFGKTHPVPRLQAWYGEEEAKYSYSGIKLNPRPWHPLLRELCHKLNHELGTQFNAVLCNLYHHGRDYAAWHSDNEKELGVNPTIASLSLGIPRLFELRHSGESERVRILLSHGSLVLMKGELQHFWKHQLAKQLKIKEMRINLTFRRVILEKA